MTGGEYPMPFPGTAEDLRANEATHTRYGDDDRCIRCCARPKHVASTWPCGVEPTRVSFDSPLTWWLL